MPTFSSLFPLRAGAAREWLRAGQDCLLCGGEARDVVCGSCERSLPVARPACVRCALPLGTEGVCGECRKAPPAFDEAFAAFAYRFPVDRLVTRFKYSADLAAGRWLAERLAERARDAPRPDLLVVPPLGAARLRGRGFNQALEIARVVARALDVALERGGLVRGRDTAAQAGLDRRERRANLRRAFPASRAFTGLHVAIVDDVMTSGATADSLAGSLRAAGATRVQVWTVARTPSPEG